MKKQVHSGMITRTSYLAYLVSYYNGLINSKHTYG